MIMIKLNDKVKYISTGRPWLKDRVGTVVNLANSTRSALVSFPSNRDYGGASEWVGISYLEVVENATQFSAARKQIMEQISSLEKQISELRKKISGLNAANKALKDLENENV